MFKNFFKKGELALLWPFYLDDLIITIFYINSAFEIIYFKNIGFSLTQIGFLLSALGLSAFIFEIPTGVFADLIGRKKSTLIGLFITMVSIFLVFFFTNYYLLLFTFALWGLGLTFVSGAYDAWVVDLLHSNKKKELVQDYFVKQHSFYSFALLFSGLIGAWLVQIFGLKVIWIVTASSFIPSIIIFYLFGKESFVRKKRNFKNEIKKFVSHTKDSTKFASSHKIISSLILASGILVLVKSLSGFLTWQPLLQNYGFQDHWFGYLYSGMMFFGIFGPFLANRIEKKIGKKTTYLMGVLAITGITLFLISFVNSVIFFVIIFLVSYALMLDLYHPIYKTFFQKHLPSRMRASVASFDSMVGSALFIVGMPLAGYLADNVGPQNTIFLASFLFIPLVIIFFRMKE